MNVLISACLLGLPCRYNGDGYPIREPGTLLADGRLHLVPVCPEQLGGLATPRPPAERAGEQVRTKAGEDVTEAYLRGADYTLTLAVRLNCRCALLKARSPSCGSGSIYDGTFSGARIPGDGVAAEVLKRAGMPVFDEEHVAEFWAFVDKESAV
jgi:uncharacterized protein YbbK (DUF523 family)